MSNKKFIIKYGILSIFICISVILGCITICIDKPSDSEQIIVEDLHTGIKYKVVSGSRTEGGYHFVDEYGNEYHITNFKLTIEEK